MNIRRKCFAAVLALLLLVSMAGTVSADDQDDAADYVRQIVNYYANYQSAAETDIDCLIYELSEIDLQQAQAWASIMDYWDYATSEMPLYPGCLPDGLPQDDSLCIVVLGYALNSDGSMAKELIGRLETALASAKKYPNAYIACTGGGTASNNKTVTEAGKMAQWLKEQGISEDRIIVENQSYSTVDNARNTCKILSESYPQVTHLALVTSDYHLPRACLLFHTQATLSALEGAPEQCVAANASYEAGRLQGESFDLLLEDLTQLAGISLHDLSKPKLSELDCILVSGSAQCMAGTELDLKVVAYYDTGLYRDVTTAVKYSGIDLAAVGMQDVTVTYEEGGIRVSSTVQIEMLAPETEPTTVPLTEPVIAPATGPAEVEAVLAADSEAPTDPRLIPLMIGIALLVVVELLLIIRLIRLKKKAAAIKAAAEAEDPPLPDDDSPLEYV